IRRGGPSARPRGRSPRVAPTAPPPAFGRPGGPSTVAQGRARPYEYGVVRSWFPAIVAFPRRGMTAFLARKPVAGLLFAAPGFVLYLLFVLVPVVATLAFSVMQIDRFNWDSEFVGLDNFVYILTD